MQQVDVNTAGGSYPIRIGKGRLDALGDAVPADASRIALVTNPTVAEHYGERARRALADSGKEVTLLTVPDGEAHKTMATLQHILDTLLQQRFDRRCLLVALGGGVIGDITGFAAAIFLRGVRFLQVPTTLLAQVDSSVGGKTGVNHVSGKNLIGAFYQPIGVEIDTDLLRTLPSREVSAGLAEVIKYGCILDAEFFAWCEQHAADLRALDPAALQYAIARSCELKAQVVGRDERESGERAILNFGHTFGHAIEAGLGFGEWLHGEAVGCGMVMAAQLSSLTCGLPSNAVERIRALVAAIGCPVQAPPLNGPQQWVELMQGDKKVTAGQIRFVLLPELGRAQVSAVPNGPLQEVLEATRNLAASSAGVPPA